MFALEVWLLIFLLHFRSTDERFLQPKYMRKLEDMLDEAYGKTWRDGNKFKEEMEKCKKMVIQCCQKPHLVSKKRTP